jgi:hypothetical protein
MNGIEKKHLSPETIEDFVLERLPADRRAEVEEHLEGCAGCQAAVVEERLIAAGTKVWARSALKQRLAERVAQTSRQRVPWPHVIGAAALLVVIVGIGVLYKWHRPTEEASQVIAETGVTDTHGSTPAVAAPTAKSSIPTNKTVEGERPADYSKKDRSISSKDKSYFPAPVAEQQEPGVADRTDKEERDQVVGLAGVAEKSVDDRYAGSGVWMRGTVIRVAPRGVAQSDAAGASTQGLSAGRIEARKSALPSSAERTLTYVLDQRHLTSDRNELSGGSAETVLALMIRTGDTLRIVLALDSLISPAQLQLGYVVRVSADSLHVVLPDRILGYRLPVDITR